MGMGRFTRRRKGNHLDMAALVITVTGGLPSVDENYETARAQIVTSTDPHGRRVTVHGGLPDWTHRAENMAIARAEFEAQQAQEQEGQQLADAFEVPENIASPTAPPDVDSAGKED